MRIRMTSAMIALAGAIVAAGACGGNDTTGGSGGAGGTVGTGGGGPKGGGGSTNSASPTSSSGFATSSASTSGSTGGSGGGSGCTELTVDDFMLLQAGEIGATFTPQLGAADPDLVDLQFYSDDTGSIDLSAAPNDNYATCNQCALVYEDITMGGVGKAYFQVSGHLTLDATSQPTEGPVSGSLSDVKLVEVTIDPQTLDSTPVPGGGCLHIASKTIDVSGGGGGGGGAGGAGAGGGGGSGTGGGAPAGWTCDPLFYNAQDGCDCNCGVYDPDCDDTSATVFGCDDGTGVCLSDGHCQAPSAWTCGQSTYDDGATCDCNCGAPDLDCDNVALPVSGCTTNQICDTSGACVTPPAGDTCGTAIAITASGMYPGTLAGMTNNYDPTDVGCTGYDEPGSDAVYSIHLDAGQSLTAVGQQASEDIALYLLSDCSAPTTACVAGADVGFSGDPETLQYTATTAGTYYLVVDTFSTSNMSPYTLSVTLQ